MIAVIGNGSLPAGDPRAQLAFEVGKALVDNGYRLVSGGLGGVMGHASAGAAASSEHREGDVVALLPGFDPSAAAPQADIVIATGLDHARNFIVANSDAVVAIGGGAGTLSEMAGAWQLDRLIIALRCEGWSGKLADERVDGRARYVDVPDDRVRGADDAGEVVALLQRWLSTYRLRHVGIPAQRPDDGK